jgi:hypothetical protein
MRLTAYPHFLPTICLLALGLAVAPARGQVETAAQRAQQDAYRVRAARFLRGRTVAPAVGQPGPEITTALALAGARTQHAAMVKTGTEARVAHPRLNGLNAGWQAVGPNQIASLAYGNVTGRLTSIAIDPADATGNTVYVGSTGGGVWKSTNAAGPAGSVTFLPLTDTLPVFSANAGTSAVPSLSTGALSIQPGGGVGEVLLAGTGDPNDATDSYYGSGILRSADGGSTWTLVQESHDGVAGNHSFLGLGTAGFAWSGATAGLVVAAMSQAVEGSLVNAADATNSVMGLYFSNDAGVTWQMATVRDGSQTVQTPLPSGENNGGNAATAVVWNPLRRSFYAAVRFHGIYQSTDGMNWTRLPAQPGAGLTTAACPTNPGMTGSTTCPLFRSALAVQPVSGDLFALTVDVNNVDQGLWQDSCGASNGSCTNASVTFATQIPAGAMERGSGSQVIAQGDYDLSLAAVPAAAGDGANTLLYAGTIDLFRCGFANGNGAACLLRNTTNALNGCAAPAQVAPAQHAIGVLALAAPLVYLGNDGGLWRSSDGVAETGSVCSAGDASHFQNLNASLGSLAEAVSLAMHPSDADTLLLGVGANGTALTAAASGFLPWTQVASGEGGYVAIDPVTPANLYVSTGPGVSVKFCSKGGSCTTADFAGTPTIGAAQVGDDASLVDPPFLLDPETPTSLVVGTCRVWRGPAQDGSSWSGANQLAQPFGGPSNAVCSATTNPVVRSLAAGGPLSNAAAVQNAGSTVLYAGLAGSLDGGGSLGGHLFATTAGATAGPATAWTDTAGTNVTNDVASGHVFNPGGFDLSSVAADPHDATGKTVYATVMGFAGNGVNAPHVYRSVNGGTSWTNISSNLPNAPANSVVVDPNDANTLYVALDTGVYVTSQVATCTAANCWSVFGASLPNAPVIDLVASPGVPTGDGRVGELRAATYGRGVWQIPLLTALNPLQPILSVHPAALTFSAQEVATQSPAQTVTVTNSGDAPLTLSSITTTGDFNETDGCTGAGSNVIGVGATCSVQVSFLPTLTGARTGVLTVFGNSRGGQATVTLNGAATAPGVIVLNPASVAFPATNIGARSAPINITISNTGGTTVALQTPLLGGADAGDFKTSANSCGTSLPAQTGCTVSIVFQPLAAGARAASFSISDDAGTQMAALSGTGTAPATDALSPPSLVFAAQVLNTTSGAQLVTLSNAGDVALTLISAQVTSGDFTAVNSCGNSLNPRSTCTISVAYVPKAVGAETGVLTVADQFRSQAVALAGTGLAPAGVSLSPFAGLTFPVTGVGMTTDPQTVTLTNNGGVTLSLQGVAITGDFLIVAGSDTCPASLPPATACTLQVVFQPTLGGTRTGTLTFMDSAGNSPQGLTLTGVGVDFTFAPSGQTTLTVASGTSAVYPFLLTAAAGTPGTASFTCLGAPVNATCVVTPQAPSLAGTTSVIVTVATGVAPTTTMISSPGSRRGTDAAVLLAGLLLPLGCFVRPIRRRGLRAALAGSISLVMMALCGCGAGRAIPPSGGTGSNGTGVVTPSGSYSIAVSATSAGLTRTTNVTLIIQ